MFEDEPEPDFEIFSALLFNSLKAITFMFFMSFAMINPVAESGKVDPKAEMMISVTWPDSSPDDIDTYVADPAGNVVWYNRREAGLMHLDRDDRGMFRDVIELNGQTIENPLNQEIISFRGLSDGEYTINVVHYIANGGSLPVQVKVEKLNPKVSLVFYDTLTLTGTGDEQTAVSFTLEGQEVKDVNNLPRGLVEMTRGDAPVKAAPAIDAQTGEVIK